MNTPTLRDLRDQIAEHGPDHFDLNLYLKKGLNVHVDPKDINFDDCGTYGCIVGHAAVLLQNSEVSTDPTWTASWPVIAQNYFNLSDYLIYGFWTNVTYGEGTLQKHAESYEKHGFTHKESQYYAVMDWLDAEVKKREEISS